MEKKLLNSSILYFALDEHSVRFDVSFLRKHLKCKVTVCSLLDRQDINAETSNEIANKHFQFVFCDDIKGFERKKLFFHLKSNISLEKLPLCLFASSKQRADEYSAMNIACIQRPYTVDSLLLAFTKAKKVQDILYPSFTDLEGHSDRQKNKVTTKVLRNKEYKENALERAHEKALGLIKRNEYILAAQTLYAAGAKHTNDFRVLASLAQAELLSANTQEANELFILAAANAVRAGRRDVAEQLCIILKKEIDIAKLFLEEAQILMEEERYFDASASLLDFVKRKTSESTNELPLLLKYLARVCQLSTNPELHLREMCWALESTGYAEYANAIRKRLLTPFEYPLDTAPTWRDNYPLLNDIYEVVSQTTRMWRYSQKGAL